MEAAKDLANVKNQEAMETGIVDFFKTKKSSLGVRNEDLSNELNSEIQEKERLYQESLEVNSLPDHIKAMSNGVFLTARRNKLSENGIFLPTASSGTDSSIDLEVDYSDTQIVLGTGVHATQVAKGMEVVLNMENFKVRLSDTLAQKVNKDYEYVVPVKVIEGVEYIYVSERDISYISNTNGVELKKEKN